MGVIEWGGLHGSRWRQFGNVHGPTLSSESDSTYGALLSLYPPPSGLGDFDDMDVSIDLSDCTMSMTSWTGRTVGKALVAIGPHYIHANTIENHKNISSTVTEVWRGYCEDGWKGWLYIGQRRRVYFKVKDTLESEGGQKKSRLHTSPRYYLQFRQVKDARAFQAVLRRCGAEDHSSANSWCK